MQFALEYKNKTNPTTLTKKKQQQQQQQKLSKSRGILKIMGKYIYSLPRIQRERTMQIENLIFFTV